MLRSHSLSVCVSVLETGTCLINSHSPTSLPQSHDLWFSAQGHFWHFNIHFHCTTRKTSAGFQGFPPYRSVIWWQDMVDAVPLVLGDGAAVGHGAATTSSSRPHTGRCHLTGDLEAGVTAVSASGKDVPGEHSPAAPSHSLAPHLFGSFTVQWIRCD